MLAVECKKQCGGRGTEMPLAKVFACTKLAKSNTNHHIYQNVKGYHLS
jgi:hypothetical protein